MSWICDGVFYLTVQVHVAPPPCHDFGMGCSTYLSLELRHYVDLAVLLGEALVAEVVGSPPRADEHLPADRRERDVLHVRPHPAVGLTIHGLWT